VMPKNSPLAWDKDSDDAILHEKRVCQILSTMGMQLPSSLAPVAPIKQRTRTRNAKTPLPTESHDAPWPDKQTVEDLYAARCRDVQGGDVEGKREQFARFESLVLARFQSHAINISCAGVGAAFADEVATLLRKGNAAVMTLDMSCNTRMRDAGAAALAPVLSDPNCTLTSIDLSSISCGPRGGAAIFDALAANQTVHTALLGTRSGGERNLIGPRPMANLAACLLRNDSLTKLSLNANAIGVEGIKLLAPGLCLSTTLRSLDLRSNSLHNNSMAHVAACLESSGLVRVNLTHNNISAAGARILAQVLSKDLLLQHLVLDSNAIGARGATAFAQGLQHNSRLTHLSLRNNGIGSAGCAALGAILPHVPAPLFGGKGAEASTAPPMRHAKEKGAGCILQTLVLGGNEIDAEGVHELCARMQHNRSLETLDLSNNRLCEASGEVFGRMLVLNAKLETLNLRGNKLRPGGLLEMSKALVQNGTLTALDLRDTMVDDSCANALATAVRVQETVTVLKLDNNYLRCHS
jgi:Ran GTPase-activating protein (RanGAP) involved in mRNA processing and transport